MKRTLQKAFGVLGYEVRRRDKDAARRYDSAAAAAECIEVVRANTMVGDEPLVSLFEQALFCESHNLPGSFVECGVWKGGSVGLMALVNLKYGKERRHIHLFDAFQEIPEPDASVDGERTIRVAMRAHEPGFSGRLRPLRGVYDDIGGPGTLEENQELLERKIGYPPEWLHYHVGWLQETLPRDADSIGEIALLRLDADLYASTRVCLEHLYDKVVRGGFVIVDDYGGFEGCRRAVDEFLTNRQPKVFLHYTNQECRYWIKP
jgi:hypothetical protein